MLFLATFKVTNASRGEGTEGEAPKSKACNFPLLPQRHFLLWLLLHNAICLAWSSPGDKEHPQKTQPGWKLLPTPWRRSPPPSLGQPEPWDAVPSGAGDTGAGWHQCPHTRAAFYLSRLSPARATANAESRGGLDRALRLKLHPSLPCGDVKEEP